MAPVVRIADQYRELRATSDGVGQVKERVADDYVLSIDNRPDGVGRWIACVVLVPAFCATETHCVRVADEGYSHTWVGPKLRDCLDILAPQSSYGG